MNIPSPPKNMRGIVRLEADKMTKYLARKVASFQAKLDKQGGKPGAANTTKNKSKGKKDFHRNRKTAATNSAPQKRTGVGKPGDTTNSTAKGSTRGQSKSKSNGNKEDTTIPKGSAKGGFGGEDQGRLRLPP